MEVQQQPSKQVSKAYLFHIGQPSDHALKVMQREKIILAREPVLIRGEFGKGDLTVEWHLSDGTVLVMERGRGPVGRGKLRYRIVEIREVQRADPS